MKRGRDKLAKVKHDIRRLARKDRALIGTITREQYLRLPDESARLAERRGLFKFWVFKVVK